MAATPRAARLLAELREKQTKEEEAVSLEKFQRAEIEAEAKKGLKPAAIKAIQKLNRTKPKTKNAGSEPRDYMQLAQDHKLKYGGTLIAAMKWVDQTFPHKRREYIKKHNPHINFD